MRFSIVIILTYLTLSAGTLGSAIAADAVTLRETRNFNREWKFSLGDHPGAEAVAFDDRGWGSIGLPHSFSMPTFGATNAFYVGYGWYRKTFDVPPDWQGRRLFLDFEGAFQEVEIFVNGRRVGTHRGGYTGFEIDITDATVTGGNLVAVRVNNHWNPRLAPRAGEHQFSGGLYRNVRLVVTAPLHVAWYGTSVSTPRVSETEGVVRVRTEVVNETSTPKACTVRTEIVDPLGGLAATMESTRRIAVGDTVVFDQTSPEIPSPRLWTPERPELYLVRTTVLDHGVPVDNFESPLGFRWFSFTADHGFFLNGKHRYLRGANVHQDHAGWGDAVADSGARRDVQMMKDAGFDFIRGSHYPHSPAFSRACDRLGMLFWSENCFWGTGGADSPWGGSAYPTDPADETGFEESVRASLRDMIRIHRNHPSIIVWSMSNEPFFSDPKVMPQVRRFLAELVAYSHELDPTRPAAIGGAQRGEIDTLGDIAGYNGDGARLFPNPGVPNIVSEYGSAMEDRPGSFEPGWGDLPLTPGAEAGTPGSWRQAWRSGEVIWCGFDHASIAGRTFGGMGMVDYFRLPKRQWYWYRKEYRGIPAPQWPTPGIPAGLTLEADRTTLHCVDGTEDVQLIVTVVDKDRQPLSNCPPVTLSIEEGPGEFPTGPSITFSPDSDIAIRDGKAAIEFRSYHAGQTRIRASSPGLADASLVIRSHGKHWFVPGVTPPAPARPYKRHTQVPTSGSWHKFGLENPTRTSSDTPGHTGRHANDGSSLTQWLAAPDDIQPWLRIDLERVVSVSAVRLSFPYAGTWSYRIEVSPDGENSWRTFVELAQTEAENPWTSYTIEGTGCSGRYLRVRLLAWPQGTCPGIADLTATGTF